MRSLSLRNICIFKSPAQRATGPESTACHHNVLQLFTALSRLIGLLLLFPRREVTHNCVCVRVARRAGMENAPSDSLKRYEVLRSWHVGNVKLARTSDYSVSPVAKKYSNKIIKQVKQLQNFFGYVITPIFYMYLLLFHY